MSEEFKMRTLKKQSLIFVFLLIALGCSSSLKTVKQEATTPKTEKIYFGIEVSFMPD